jgi:hypothetical protein
LAEWGVPNWPTGEFVSMETGLFGQGPSAISI